MTRFTRAQERLLTYLTRCGGIMETLRSEADPETREIAEKALEEAAARIAEMKPIPRKDGEKEKHETA
jgi:hypothetical protein